MLYDPVHVNSRFRQVLGPLDVELLEHSDEEHT